MFWSSQRQHLLPKKAIWDVKRSVTYPELSSEADQVARALLAQAQCADLRGARVAFWVPASVSYVSTQWGIWRAGGVAVPLCVQHPAHELEHALRESDSSWVICDTSRESAVKEAALRTGVQSLDLSVLLKPESLTRDQAGVTLPIVDETWGARPAQILFTSGTTGKPKGAVATHDNIDAQVRTLLGAWGWSQRDHTLGVLPLHHTHGIINVLSCALAAGASIELFEKVDAATLWDRMIRPREGARVTVFMAVPTIYTILADHYDLQAPITRTWFSDAASQLRLWVSGSAALPVMMLERWKAISRHTLLERYGMTEIGMALSNPLSGARKAGSVGLPLPGVEVRLVDDSGVEVLGPDRAGEIQVRGSMVFQGYFGRAQATQESFTPEGWFKTGDQAVRDHEGYYKILGRSSIDILKTGGYKVSALEIEETLRGCPGLKEVCVVGVPDEKWGERVAAAFCWEEGQRPHTQALLEAFAREHLARYKVPSLWLEIQSLPRNAMGKVLKPEVTRMFLMAARGETQS